MELRHALPPLLACLGDFAIDLDRVTWKQSFALRGRLTLPVTLAP